MKKLLVVCGTVLLLIASKNLVMLAAPSDDAPLQDLPPPPFGWDSFDTHRPYRVDPYILAAEKLQMQGKDKAVEILRAAVRSKRSDGSSVIVLCRMLFTAKKDRKFRAPLLGDPGTFGGTRIGKWSRVPIEIVDGVPFMIVTGYTLAGLAEPPEIYLDYCLEECDWSSFEFKPKSEADKKLALEKLIASSKWKRPLQADEKDYLSLQISRTD